ncbi:MAG: ornithine cyclodeaminase family protein [Burkholderiales bacterium]|jgi:ornithine cyclodeaminase|nr:ornithine cyclodeaminase family protein [Burkholderiales bacterium]
MTPSAGPPVAARFGGARLIDADTIRAATPWAALIEHLAHAFAADDAVVPPRHHHVVTGVDAGPAHASTLLLMPAWRPGGSVGVKLVQVAPDNATRGLPAVHATYLLSDATTGVPRALLDGDALTLRRTAAVSALAAQRLARPDAQRLLVIGAGRLAPELAEAHAAVRAYAEIVIWARRAEAAHATAAAIAARTRVDVRVATDLDAAVGAADVVTCATLATTPLVRGACVRPGTHVDLVGAFKPHMRESDDALLQRAAVWVDTREGACREAGDLTQPIASGAFDPAHLRGDLTALCRRPAGLRDAGAVTLFKAVGTALADLATAERVVAVLDAADR